MLTKLVIRNFKRFGEAEIELGNPVVFVGPNNSGKTSAMQALALWGVGVKRWNKKGSGKAAPEKRPGVTVNRRDLAAVPVPDANLLWRALRVRDVGREDGRQVTRNVRIDVVVEGVTALRRLVRPARFAEPDGQEEFSRAGGARAGGRNRPRDRRQARRDRAGCGAGRAIGRPRLTPYARARDRHARPKRAGRR